MANQQLVDYIKTQNAAGVARADTQKALVAAGWPLQDIQGAFAAADGRVVSPALAPKPAAVAAVQPQVQPQQPQVQPLPVIHMHPQEGILHSTWFWSLVALVLLVGAATAIYFVTPVGDMVNSYFAPKPAPVVIETPVNEYKDPQGSFTFIYPEGRMPVPKAVLEERIMANELSTSTLPAGTVEIPGVMLVSKMNVAELSIQNPVYDYFSGCCGVRYWLDATSTTWKAETIGRKPEGGPLLTPLSLATTTPTGQRCTLARTAGPYTLYRVRSGDEGVPYHYYYYLLTDKSYAMQFMTLVDLDATTTDPTIRQTFDSVVSSFKLIDSVPVVGHCS